MRLRQIIREDLRFSLYFEEIIDSIEKEFSLTNWFPLQVKAVIRCEVFYQEITNSPMCLIRIYDMFIRKKISEKKYLLYSHEFRATAHRISNYIIKTLTGEEGICTTKIVFSIRKGKSKVIGMVDYDGYNFKQLIKKKGLHLAPKWVKGENAITYMGYKGEDIWLYKLNISTGKTEILSNIRGINMGSEWSLVLNGFLLTLTKDGNPEIYFQKGNSLTRLTVHKGIDTSPTWAPNSMEIAFVSNRSGSPQIYIMGKDGSNVRRLTFSGSYNTSPAWSPKGDRIAYVSREVDGTFQIHTILTDGEEDMYLTWKGNNTSPHWSPDGLHLCFISDRNGIPELFVMHWDGTGQRRIGRFGDGCDSPRWSQ
jgi:TolB protein